MVVFWSVWLEYIVSGKVLSNSSNVIWLRFVKDGPSLSGIKAPGGATLKNFTCLNSLIIFSVWLSQLPK